MKRNEKLSLSLPPCVGALPSASQTTVLDPADTLGLEEALKKHKVPKLIRSEYPGSDA